MRTTVDIPDPVYRRLKAKAAEQDCSVRQLILRSVEREIGERSTPGNRVRLPLLRSKTPGTLRLTNEQVYEIIPFP